jgi:glyoxylase-like metal-dependent hydrolase (beta-lactamase superfamily II)
MRQISALMLLGVAIGIMAPLGAAGRVEPVQAQNQAPPEAFRIIGNIYWVGGEYGSYLITTPQGHILHDTGSNEMHDVIVSNVKKLGFDVKDIKLIISSPAHWDHVQGHAAMKKVTGAQVIALAAMPRRLKPVRTTPPGDSAAWWRSTSIASSRTGIRFPWAA